MKRIIPVIIILAIVAGVYWRLNQPRVDASASTALIGSGTIEAETIAIISELGGRITALKVAEGDEVTAGQVLVEIDQSNLLAQQAQLEAALATAKASLEAVSAPPRPEDIAAAAARLVQAKAARDGAKVTWETAQALVNNPHQLQAQINQAQARVTEAQSNLELAQVNLKRMEIQAEAASRNQSNHPALVQNEVAQHQLKAAQVGLQMAEVSLIGAKQQVELLQYLRKKPLQLISQANAAKAAYQQTEAAVLVTEAHLAAAQAHPTMEDIDVAQAKVREAEATLAQVQVQLAKLTLVAPRGGLISQRLVNPGELAAPGTVLLELRDIDTVDLTVYIPETLIGRVKVGQQAHVHVDAYPGQVFEGAVSFIAHQAEFTPRNVQTREERVNLVFGVKITLDNPDHRLKPGMPADAEILPGLTPPPAQASSPTVQAEATSAPAIKLTSTALPLATPNPISSKDTPEAATPLPTKTALATHAEIITWGLNVRGGPGIKYAVIAHLVKGNLVEVIEVDPSTGWLKVALPNSQASGWISNNPAYVLIR